jgi:ABC-type Fe3+/spermidine/putrescine transport system ATPase subunit
MIRLENLRVELGKFALEDISLTIADGEYFIIVGPTGAGKTVLLETIAGLNPVKKGAVWLKDRDITDHKPEKRGMSIVYQDHALFPHLTVKDNILFGLRLRQKTPQELSAAQEWLTELLNISHLLKRKPHTLSGGERQKVALARALSTRPDVLLLDEPLSALDPETRETVQEELDKLHRTLNNTIIHVTHDFEEAMALGTRVAVIGRGRLKQVGTPEEVFQHPNSEFVARFVMARNILEGTATKRTEGSTVFSVGGMEFWSTAVLEGSCRASIRAEDIQISRQLVAGNPINCFPAIISKIVKKGWALNVTAALPLEISCLVTRRQFEEIKLEIGQQIYLIIPPSSVHLFRNGL